MTKTMTSADTGQPRTCIVQPRLGVLTETFIEAHRRYLPGAVLRLDCDPFPIISESGRPLISIFHPWIHRAMGRLLGLSSSRADGILARMVPARLRESILARHLRSQRIGVVLAEYGPTGVAVRRACKAARLPLVVHFHGYDAYQQETLNRYASDYRRLFNEASTIVAVSRHMCDQLIDLGATQEKVEFNPYGVDVDSISKAVPENAPPVFLAVGRFVAKKAPDVTIDAFARISARFPDARLEIIGDGPLRESCREQARHLGVEESVTFHGPLSHPEVGKAMTRVRCFVQHSVTAESGDMEGTPLAVLEAMAAGLPVVATRHGGIVDVVSNEETGLLVDEMDVEGMADAMARLINSPTTAARMGNAGRAFVLDNHSMETRIGVLAKILQRAATSRIMN